MLSLDSLSQVNLTVRGLITISLMLSLIAVYFALVQQRELLLGSNADGLRKWLWSGRTRALPPSTRSRSHLPSPSHPKGSDPRTLGDRKVRESSLAANIVLQAPYELLGIAISVFLGALTAYLGLAMAQNVELGTGTLPGNTGVFVAFVICTVFTLCVFGQSLGQKDREMARCAGDGEEVSQERAA